MFLLIFVPIKQVMSRRVGFTNTLVDEKDAMKIGIIDADLLDNGTRHPNLALLKISGYCKSKNHSVRLLCDYKEVSNNYDLLVMSKVFKFSVVPDNIMQLIEDGKIVIGGTGFYEVGCPYLPDEVEHFMPDYTLYDEFIEKKTAGDIDLIKRDWSDFKFYSIGFTTRGCIRQCGFCVNRELFGVKKWSPVEEFLDKSRKAIYLWDDNIMAAPPRIFKAVMDDLIATDKPFQFRQGMDIRLMTDAKAELLNRVKYHGDYIFAFDHYRLDIPAEKAHVEQTVRGLEVWRRHCRKSTKLYVLVGYDGQDAEDIRGAFYRIKILMEYGCLPYIMRFEKSYTTIPVIKNMYTQLARWCNQPSFFKKKSFREYCLANEEYRKSEQKKTEEKLKALGKKPKQSKKQYSSCYQAMIDFEKEYPEIAQEYFDLRFDQLNRFANE